MNFGGKGKISVSISQYHGEIFCENQPTIPGKSQRKQPIILWKYRRNIENIIHPLMGQNIAIK